MILGQSLNQALPASQAGRMAEHLLESFNSGDKKRQQDFLEKSLSKRAKDEKPLSEYLLLLEKAYAQSGGLVVGKIERSEPNPFLFHVRTVHGNHWARIYLFLDKVEDGKIGSFGILPLADPSLTDQLSWPRKPSSEKEVVSEIEKHVRLMGQNDHFSGVVLVGRDHDAIARVAVGLAEQSFAAPNKIDTKFNLGSMNKMFTSLSIAQLLESGKISLEDNVGSLLANYPNRETASKITVRHLLSHTAGLGGLFERPGYDNRKKYTTNTELLPVFANEPLFFPPGSRNSYSNEGYIVLGAIIEDISGQGYHEYVREHIFGPAGMKDSGPYALDETVPNLAIGYMRYEDDPFGIEPRHPNHMFLGWRGNACGGGYSTAPDLLRFANKLKQNEFVKQEITNEFTRRQGPMKNYGFGFEIEEIQGRKIVGHTGGGPNSGVNSALKILWNEPYTVIVLGNYDAPVAQDLAGEIASFLAG